MFSDLKSKTAKGLAWGALTSLLQMVLGLVFGILIARILSPSDYGMVGMLSIFSSLAIVLQESGFVFVLANRKNLSNREFSTVFWFNISISVLLYILLFVAAPFIGSFYGIKELVPLSRFIFLGFIFSSLGVVQNAFLYRQLKVKERGLSKIVGLVVSGIVGIILAIKGFQYWGIAIQGLLATIISTIILWILSPFRPQFVFDTKFFKEVFLDGVKFAVPNFVSVIGVNIYSIILGKFYTVQEVGYYCQADKFNNYGYSTVLSMVRNVSQPMLVEMKNQKGNVLLAFRKLVRFTALVSIPTMFLLSLSAPEVINILLTSKWASSAEILRILCIGGAFASLSTLSSYLVISQNKSFAYMVVGVTLSLLKISLAFLASFGGALLLAYICAFIDLFSFIIYYVVTRRCINYSPIQLLSDIAPLVIISIIMIMVGDYLASFSYNILIRFIIKVSVALVLLFSSLELIKYDIYIESRHICVNKIRSIWSTIF